METADTDLRHRIKAVLCNGAQALDRVLAGWESGSVAFDLEDIWSDIDLNFLLADTLSSDAFFDSVESLLGTVSPVVASLPSPPGRYYKLRDGGDFLLVDVCVYRHAEVAERLDPARHGRVRPLFDKGHWLKTDADSVAASQSVKRAQRLAEHRAWFQVNQGFVHKAMWRGRKAEAMAAYWAYTLRPLIELVRMRHCPARWDFGMRYLEHDLPAPACDAVVQLVHVGESDDLGASQTRASAWAEQLLHELSELQAEQPVG